EAWTALHPGRHAALMYHTDARVAPATRHGRSRQPGCHAATLSSLSARRATHHFSGLYQSRDAALDRRDHTNELDTFTAFAPRLRDSRATPVGRMRQDLTNRISGFIRLSVKPANHLENRFVTWSQ